MTPGDSTFRVRRRVAPSGARLSAIARPCSKAPGSGVSINAILGAYFVPHASFEVILIEVNKRRFAERTVLRTKLKYASICHVRSSIQAEMDSPLPIGVTNGVSVGHAESQWTIGEPSERSRGTDDLLYT